MARGKTRDHQVVYYRLLGIVFVMVLFGLIMILSSSSIKAFASTGDSYYYIKKQLVAAVIGSVALFVFARIPLRSLQKLVNPIVVAVVVMLAAVLIPGVGKEAGGATSWIPIGIFQIQPAEFAKIAVILLTADFLTRKRGHLNDLKEWSYPYGILTLFILGLIMMQPDMGTMLAICMIVFSMIFVGGVNLRYIAGFGALGLAAVVSLIYSRSYRSDRITSFLDPTFDPLGKGHQIKQSLIALGSGGMFGIGLGMSRQKYFYLPEAHTDFIFAIIGEELGLLGTFFTISLFALFAYYGVRISYRCKNHFGRLVGVGFTSMVILQTLVNMGAVTRLLPITGLPMPFISYGGSSLIVNLAAVGVLLSIAVENGRETASSRKRRQRLFIVEDEETQRKRTTTRKRKKSSSKGSTRKTASSSRSKSTASSKKESTGTSSNTTRRTKANASSNKRRRNSGTRVSGSSSRRGPSKSKKRP